MRDKEEMSIGCGIAAKILTSLLVKFITRHTGMEHISVDLYDLTATTDNDDVRINVTAKAVIPRDQLNTYLRHKGIFG